MKRAGMVRYDLVECHHAEFAAEHNGSSTQRCPSCPRRRGVRTWRRRREAARLPGAGADLRADQADGDATGDQRRPVLRRR